MSADPYDWRGRHNAAVAFPTATERPLINLLSALDTFVDLYASDYVLREGIADLINGTRRLLDADHGPRLDMGTVWEHLSKAADKINYDMDLERFKDERD